MKFDVKKIDKGAVLGFIGLVLSGGGYLLTNMANKKEQEKMLDEIVKKHLNDKASK